MADKYKILYGNIIDHSGGPSNEGLLISTPEDGNVWLKDARGKTLKAGSVPFQVMKSFRGGNVTHFGIFKVLLERIIREKPREVPKAKPVVEEIVVTKPALDKRNERELDKKPNLDIKLLGMMHKHQAEAAKFLLARLLGEDSNGSDSSSGELNASKRNENVYASSDLAMTGCILADENGFREVFDSLMRGMVLNP